MDNDQKVTTPAWEDIGKDKEATEANLKRIMEDIGNRPLPEPDNSIPNRFPEMNNLPRGYLVDKILPMGEVHLIAGPSGAGKSTWLYGEFIPNWSQRKPIFGYESHAYPYIVVSMERSIPSINETLARLKRTGIPVTDGRACVSVPEVIQKGLDIVPDARVFFVEGFALMAPAGFRNDYAHIGKFLTDTSRLCEERGLTIIGTVHMPKMRKGEALEDPRQRISGTVAWAAMSDTVILIEREDPADITNRIRNITLLPRNEADSTHRYEIGEEGILSPCKDGTASEILATLVEDMDTEFSFAELVAEAKAAGVSRATVGRWLNTSTVVSWVRKGLYRKVSP